MFMESTYMKLGHCPPGTNGLATSQRQVVLWALIYGELNTDLKEPSTPNSGRVQTHHREEAKVRIAADSKDRASIHRTFSLAIGPLKAESHSGGRLLKLSLENLLPLM
jgi:hypothetical protein